MLRLFNFAVGNRQIKYYGFYSNKSRGMREKDNKAVAAPGQQEPDTPFRRKCRITWAALIKAVYEVDPLKCPKCGGTMKIVTPFLKRKVKYTKYLLPIIVLLSLQYCFSAQKVLVIVEQNIYYMKYPQILINQYCDDIQKVEGKKVEMIHWPAPSGGTNVALCRPLQSRLEDEYFEALNSGDSLEGVVMIGNLPMPITDPSLNGWGEGVNGMPLDHVFMDIVNRNTTPPSRNAFRKFP